MLSVLIPTYNYDCRKLVEEVCRQAEQLQIPYEILVADDGSAEDTKKRMREINQWPSCRFLEMERNVGRAVIRNVLARKASYPYLLFLDADAGIVSSAFLKEYLQQANESSVVYGGVVYPDDLPPVGRRLRYYYGIRREQLTLAQRKREPYRKFNSINFLIFRDLFMKVLFDESFVTYGHEDTYFGLQLRKQDIPIKHIDNPVVHYNQDTDEEFLRKTRTSVRGLYDKRKLLEEVSGLLHILKRLNTCHMVTFSAFWFRLFHKKLERNLSGRKNPSIRLLSVYKLGYLCSCQVSGGN